MPIVISHIIYFISDTDELTFQKGDIFFVHNDLGDGWLWVTAHRTGNSTFKKEKFIDYWNLTIFSSFIQGEQGLVFKDLLRDLEQNIDPNVVFPWFHRVLTKDEAVKMLVRGKLKKFGG